MWRCCNDYDDYGDYSDDIVNNVIYYSDSDDYADNGEDYDCLAVVDHAVDIINYGNHDSSVGNDVEEDDDNDNVNDDEDNDHDGGDVINNCEEVNDDDI